MEEMLTGGRIRMSISVHCMTRIKISVYNSISIRIRCTETILLLPIMKRNYRVILRILLSCASIHGV